ncbi:MAG: helix-turn-helix domain-containing protein [Clostridiales bacterium]|nr:helix-turn-helix domain-containing protein [Clostridiales bacterium]
MMNFGDRLKTLRTQKNLTQQQLADRLGLTKSVISAYETQLHRPSYETLVQLSRIFRVSTDYLLGVERSADDFLDISGLTEEEKQALRGLVRAMRAEEQF